MLLTVTTVLIIIMENETNEGDALTVNNIVLTKYFKNLEWFN